MAVRWNIEPHLRRKRWTAYNLALQAGLTPSAVYKLIKKDEVQIIEVPTLEALAKALDCRPWDLLEYRR